MGTALMRMRYESNEIAIDFKKKEKLGKLIELAANWAGPQFNPENLQILHSGIILNPENPLEFYNSLGYHNFYVRIRDPQIIINDAPDYFQMRVKYSVFNIISATSSAMIRKCVNDIVNINVENLDQTRQDVMKALCCNFNKREIIDLVNRRIEELQVQSEYMDEEDPPNFQIQTHSQFRQMRLLMIRNSDFLNNAISTLILQSPSLYQLMNENEIEFNKLLNERFPAQPQFINPAKMIVEHSVFQTLRELIRAHVGFLRGIFSHMIIQSPELFLVIKNNLGLFNELLNVPFHYGECQFIELYQYPSIYDTNTDGAD